VGVYLGVTIRGGFSSASADVGQRIAEGETLAAHRLMALSTEQAPLDLGTLIGSAAVTPATDPEEGAAVSYDTPYAARHHEHPEYNFQNGRKGKYLEDPAVENRDELGAIIAKRASGA
jgi:hypothetical protein